MFVADSTWLIIPWAGLFVLSLAAVVRGWRGRWLERDPHGRKSRYNFTGLASPQCPECGADVTKPKAVVIGRRKRGHAMLLFGAIGVMAGVCIPAIPDASRVWRLFDRYDYYSVNWLVRDARRGEQRAFEHLGHRIHQRMLSLDEMRMLVKEALAQQPNIVTPDDHWVALAGRLMVAEVFTPEQKRQWVTQGLQAWIAAPCTIKIGEPLPVDVRLSQNFHSHFFVYLADDSLALSGKTWSNKSEHSIRESVRTSSLYKRLWRDSLHLDIDDLVPGKHTLTYEAVMHVWFLDPRMPGHLHVLPDSPDFIIPVTATNDCEIEVMPRE